MIRDYTTVVKNWPGSYLWTSSNNGVCSLNTIGSGLENFSTKDPPVTSQVLPSNWDSKVLQRCNYKVDDVSIFDEVTNFGLIYGENDPDKVLLMGGYCKKYPTDGRCVGIEETICSTFPHHPDCIMNVETTNWSWVYTVLIIALAIGLGYFMSSPSKTTTDFSSKI